MASSCFPGDLFLEIVYINYCKLRTKPLYKGLLAMAEKCRTIPGKTSTKGFAFSQHVLVCHTQESAGESSVVFGVSCRNCLEKAWT